MRSKEKTIVIKVKFSTKKRLENDKKHFQKVIGGGLWSLDDTIKEYHKILDGFKYGEKK